MQVNATSNCNYDYEMLYFDQMIDYARENICPDTAQSEVSKTNQALYNNVKPCQAWLACLINRNTAICSSDA